MEMSTGMPYRTLLLCAALQLLHIGVSGDEAEIFIVNPAPNANLQSGFFELEFVAVWRDSDRTQHLYALIGGGFATPGGYSRDLTHLLDGKNGSGEHSLSTVLRTPAHQVAVKIALLLTNEDGDQLAIAAHEVTVSPDRPVAVSCLLSYPGSGNHLMRFMLEFITKRPTLGVDYFKDLSLAENHYRDGNPLWEVDLLAQPASEKFHITRDYPSVHQDSRDFSQRCTGKLILLLRDFHEVIPRFINAVRDGNAEHELWHAEPLARRIETEARVFLDNVQAFATFAGPTLLVHYATLKANPSAVAVAVGSFLGGDAQRHHAARVREWVQRAEELAQQCLTAEGREWQGQRSTGAAYKGSHLSGWSDAEAAALLRVWAEASQEYSAEVQALCRPALLALLALLYRRDALDPAPLHALL